MTTLTVKSFQTTNQHSVARGQKTTLRIDWVNLGFFTIGLWLKVLISRCQHRLNHNFRHGYLLKYAVALR
jgi:hypothetical protein